MSAALIQRASHGPSRIVSASFLRANHAISLSLSLFSSLSLLVIKHIIGFIPAKRRLPVTSTHVTVLGSWVSVYASKSGLKTFFLLSSWERERGYFKEPPQGFVVLSVNCLAVVNSSTQQADEHTQGTTPGQTLSPVNDERKYTNRINYLTLGWGVAKISLCRSSKKLFQVKVFNWNKFSIKTNGNLFLHWKN